MSNSSLSREDLVALVERVFPPRPDDTGLAFLVDLPDAHVGDGPARVERRAITADWAAKLAGSDLGLPVHLDAYRNARTIVPYEAEDEPSRSRGVLPVEVDGEVVFYTIENNKATGVTPEGGHRGARDRAPQKRARLRQPGRAGE